MAKKVKIKLPKQVAGIKIPKVVRKGPLGQFLNSGAGQLILAETLVAAAAVFTAAKTDPNSAVGDVLRHPAQSAGHLGHTLADAGSHETERLSYALKEAARAFREALQNGNGGAASTAAARENSPETHSDDAGAKKKSSTRGFSGTPH